MEYPPETVDALGFAPIGLDEPYRVIALFGCAWEREKIKRYGPI
jgi:hypothetical protein